MKTMNLVLGLLVAIFVLPGFAFGASFLEEEAGISAHAKLDPLTAQNLIDAATAYKTIERQTAEYIVGSVALPNYSEADDVHGTDTQRNQWPELPKVFISSNKVVGIPVSRNSKHMEKLDCEQRGERWNG